MPSYRPEPLKAGSRVRRRSREDVPVVTSCLLALGCPNARPIADVPWNNIPDDREFSRNTRNRDSTRKSSLQSRPGCSAKRSPSQLPSNQVLLRRKRTWAWTPPSHGSKSGIEACGPAAAQLLHKCCKWGYVGILQLRAARGPRARIAQELRTILWLGHTVKRSCRANKYRVQPRAAF